MHVGMIGVIAADGRVQETVLYEIEIRGTSLGLDFTSQFKVGTRETKLHVNVVAYNDFVPHGIIRNGRQGKFRKTVSSQGSKHFHLCQRLAQELIAGVGF